jgi:outer membrane receptor for monomeric catechols
MDPSNAFEYTGHDLLTFRGHYRITSFIELYLHVSNLTDARYAERAIYNSFRGEEWTPGAPRSVVGGIRYGV